MDVDVIDLCESDSEGRLSEPSRKKLKTHDSPALIKEEGVARISPVTWAIDAFDVEDDDEDDDEVEVIEKPGRSSFGEVENAKTTGDDEWQSMGLVDHLPHLRCHCPDYSFVRCNAVCSSHTTRNAIATNQKKCALCWCYVCDKLGSECSNWTPKEDDVVRRDVAHCLAHDTGNDYMVWKEMRESKNNPATSSRASSPLTGCIDGIWIDRIFSSSDDCDDETSLSSSPYPPVSHTHDSPALIKKEGVARISPGASAIDDLDDGDNDDVEIVEKAGRPSFGSIENAKTNGEDEVQVVGFIGDRLPHVRCHCPDNIFVHCNTVCSSYTTRKALETNQKKCDKCYCYVCDKPASECTNWTPKEDDVVRRDVAHCLAHDTGNDSMVWKEMRESTKNTATSSRSSSPILNWTTADGTSSSIGPFPPDYDIYSHAESNKYKKCRKCCWYNRTPDNPWNSKTSCHQWCQKCGRVARNEYLSQKQFRFPYEKQPHDVLLGHKTISFKIHPRDPRKMARYKQSWEINGEVWTYDEAEMREDAFKHRLGRYVTPRDILHSLPVLENIPSDGRFEPRTSNPYSTCRFDVSVSETEAVLLDNQNDIFLLQQLATFASFGMNEKSVRENEAVAGHVEAVWDRISQSGTFTVTLYLRPGIKPMLSSSCMSKLLGTWFRVFPFPVASLGRGLTAKLPSSRPLSTENRLISIPPFQISREKEKALREEMHDTIQNSVDKFNGSISVDLSKLSLTSSNAGKAFLGGTTSSSPGDFRSFLRRYFSEVFVDDIFSTRNDALSSRRDWIAEKLGVISSHRDMLRVDSSFHLTLKKIEPRSLEQDACFSSYVEKDDLPLATENLVESAAEVRDYLCSLSSLMQHLENLGHESFSHVEGLSVDLLPFQKESVQWALERERHGAQSFLWAEIPHVEDTTVKKLYLNPILNRVVRNRPRMVRGGLICEEMGLGKTIISLALILANPAPAHPESGCVVPDTFVEEGDDIGWDPDLMPLNTDQGETIMRGSILSRGTLVVCHVSLVGQWCEEARSKLSNPGLVYPYHGSGRKRDARALAQNSIVVTTYATLSSDSNYHRKRGESDYCPPCERVRWWRIIFDESHTMRNANTKQSRAVMDLVSDHRWAVTGTPVSTSLNDLRNQLTLVGFEDINAYFQLFVKNVMVLINDRGKHKCGYDRQFGDFAFFMRNIMIRHTKHQKYRGTDTELMALPQKNERTLEVIFTDEERAEYSTLENEAIEFYLSLKETCKKQVNQHYLLLSSVLKVQRCACSGGRFPLTPLSTLLTDDEDKSVDEGDDSKKKKRKKKVEFSEFVFTSKLKTLIAELTKIRDEEPGSKSLIFSNFASTLEWLREELPKHGFTIRHINGSMPQKRRGAALREFQEDPSTTVFLLSMRSSNCGINLTSANRVFLLEPSINPATIQQAIGRVHRLGQTRNVEIVQMIVMDSIETRLIKMLKKKYEHTVEVDGDGQGGQQNPAAVAFVGNLTADKATMVENELDLLFGLEEQDS